MPGVVTLAGMIVSRCNGGFGGCFSHAKNRMAGSGDDRRRWQPAASASWRIKLRVCRLYAQRPELFHPRLQHLLWRDERRAGARSPSLAYSLCCHLLGALLCRCEHNRDGDGCIPSPVAVRGMNDACHCALLMHSCFAFHVSFCLVAAREHYVRCWLAMTCISHVPSPAICYYLPAYETPVELGAATPATQEHGTPLRRSAAFFL